MQNRTHCTPRFPQLSTQERGKTNPSHANRICHCFTLHLVFKKEISSPLCTASEAESHTGTCHPLQDATPPPPGMLPAEEAMEVQGGKEVKDTILFRNLEKAASTQSDAHVLWSGH